MSGWLAFAALIAAIGTLQALLCAVLVALSMPLIRPRLKAAAMGGRTLGLLVVAALPLITGTALIVAAIAPSLATNAGFAGDHCFVHLDHALHLCLHHLPNIAPTLTVSAVVAVGSALLLSALGRAANLLRLGREEGRSLAAVAKLWDGVGWIHSQLPLAVTVGFLRPAVFVSSGLKAGLDDDELNAAIAHERCHASERHALLKLLGSVAAMFHLPSVRRELASLTDLACERRADEQAAREVVDRLRVASALVRAHRLVSARPTLAGHGALAFASCTSKSLDCRVRALVDDTIAPRNRADGWLLVGALAAFVSANHELHHGIEHLLALLV